MPSSASCLDTTIWVAMPAWSVPGSHSVLSPIIRCQRTVTSISVCSSICPMCSTPVTFGGGITSENTRRGTLLEAAKMPESIHHWAQCGSKRPGSYTFSICMGNTMITSRSTRRLIRLAKRPQRLSPHLFGRLQQPLKYERCQEGVASSRVTAVRRHPKHFAQRVQRESLRHRTSREAASIVKVQGQMQRGKDT